MDQFLQPRVFSGKAIELSQVDIQPQHPGQDGGQNFAGLCFGFELRLDAPGFHPEFRSFGRSALADGHRHRLIPDQQHAPVSLAVPAVHEIVGPPAQDPDGQVQPEGRAPA